MPKVETDFMCLRCRHEYKGLYSKTEPEEHACPKCGSNSQRPLKKKKQLKVTPAGADAKKAAAKPAATTTGS